MPLAITPHQEFTQIVGQHEELQLHRVGRKAVAGEPGPASAILSLLDPLLCRLGKLLGGRAQFKDK